MRIRAWYPEASLMRNVVLFPCKRRHRKWAQNAENLRRKAPRSRGWEFQWMCTFTESFKKNATKGAVCVPSPQRPQLSCVCFQKYPAGLKYTHGEKNMKKNTNTGKSWCENIPTWKDWKKNIRSIFIFSSTTHNCKGSLLRLKVRHLWDLSRNLKW